MISTTSIAELYSYHRMIHSGVIAMLLLIMRQFMTVSPTAGRPQGLTHSVQ